jgi:predicted glycoside hydrolase/deacetylase ChbG (UPF0249 family)
MNLNQALALANRFEEDGVISASAQAIRVLAQAYRAEASAHELTSRYARALELLAKSGV